MPHVVPAHPANPAPPAPHFPWPGGKSCAMFLSFDVDAETAWTSKDPALAEHLVTMSFGGYEARVGVPMLLDMLRRLGLRATFFTTGWAADAHPAMCESILAAGHEIGHHGYHHLMPDPADPAAMEEELDRGFEALHRRLGVVPTGYRAPFGESFEGLRASLARRGMVYSSSWRDDVRPYRQVLADGTPGVIELPVTLSYDDWLYGLTNRHSPRPLFPREHVLSIWKDELEVTRQWGGMVTTVLHPQVSGRPMRLGLLREFLTHAVVQGDVWIATGREIAAHFRMHEAATQPATPDTVPHPVVTVAPAPVAEAAPPAQEEPSPTADALAAAVVPDLVPAPTVAAAPEAEQAPDEAPAAADTTPPPEQVVEAAASFSPEPPLTPPAEAAPEAEAPPPPRMAEPTPLQIAEPSPPRVAEPPMPRVAEPSAQPEEPAAAPLEPPSIAPVQAEAAPEPAAAPPPPQPEAAVPPPPAEPVPTAPPAPLPDKAPPLAAFPPLTATTQPPPPSSRLLRPPPPPPPLSPRPPQRFGLFGRSKP